MNAHGNFFTRRLSVVSSLGVWCAVLGWGGARAADFTVTTPGGVFAFTVNGVGGNPTITLVRGRTYEFAIGTSSFHPFKINATEGVTNNIISSGTITYAVPTNAADTTYICGFHFSFGGPIEFVDPPPPPTSRVVDFSFNESNIVLRSTVSNASGFVPEFNTNLLTTNWMPMTVQTNTSLNGTNETICGRPPGDAVFIRIKAQPN